jgi:outer membrane protein OmpA-like peptidoglycan-associated protein
MRTALILAGGLAATLLAPVLANAQGVTDMTGRRVGRCDIARELGGPLPVECGGRGTGTAEGTRGRLVIQNPSAAVPQQDRAATTAAPGAGSQGFASPGVASPGVASPSVASPGAGSQIGAGSQAAAAPAARAIPGRTVALTVLFELGSAKLTGAARQQLDELAAVILANPNDRFGIEGHTDARGGDELNQDLSERRAAAAIEYLVNRHGIARDRLEARGYGRNRPLVPADPFDGRNRRVQVTIIGS